MSWLFGPLSRRLFREPLVGFALVGALAFSLDRGRSAPDHSISVDAPFREALVSGFAKERGRPATRDEAEGLVAAFVHEEVLYREAVSRGLDRGDLIVRRRLVQKMKFVLAAECEIPEPSAEDLERFLESHADAFAEPPTITFEHVFFRRSEASRTAHLEAAESAKQALSAGAAPAALGDPFPRGNQAKGLTAQALSRDWGEAVSTAVLRAEIGAWTGPVESAWGAHVIRVETRSARLVPPLAAVASAVRAEWIREARARAAAEAERALVDRWREGRP